MISLLDSLIYVVLAGALSFEAVNFILLIKLRHWSLTAGKNLIGQVVRALNIKSNALFNPDGEKGETVKEALKNIVENEQIQPIIDKIAQSPEAGNFQLDIPSLVQGFITGQITRQDLIQYAPLILKYFQGNNGNTGKNPERRW
jgi:hypothetical protein